MSKLCRTCGIEKPRGDFHVRQASVDGLAAKCRDCQKEYDRARSHLPHRLALRKTPMDSVFYCIVPDNHPAKADRMMAEYNRNPKRWQLRVGEWKSKNPKKRLAQGAVGNAIRDGKMTKDVLCQFCGTYGPLHGHHRDYDKPIDVQWLCVPCHKQWHVTNGPGLNG